MKKNSKGELKLMVSDATDEIVVDAGLIDCINMLNQLRDTQKLGGVSNSIKIEKKEKDVLVQIQQISAEMRWFSQWLTAKVRSAA